MKLEKLGPVRAYEFVSFGLKDPRRKVVALEGVEGVAIHENFAKLNAGTAPQHLSVQLAFQPLLLVLRRVFSFVRNDARGGGRKPGFSGYPPGLFAGVNGFLFPFFHPGPEPGF